MFPFVQLVSHSKNFLIGKLIYIHLYLYLYIEGDIHSICSVTLENPSNYRGYFVTALESL